MKESKKIRVFIDMDGTLCEWNTNLKSFEDLFAQGYFFNLKPHPNMIKTIHELKKNHKFELFILSAYLEESKTALTEKKLWLDKYIGDLIDYEHRLFVPTTEEKASVVPGGIMPGDILIDDYTVNLVSWKKRGGKGIKVMNGVNGNFGKWNGSRLFIDHSPTDSYERILTLASQEVKCDV